MMRYKLKLIQRLARQWVKLLSRQWKILRGSWNSTALSQESTWWEEVGPTLTNLDIALDNDRQV